MMRIMIVSVAVVMVVAAAMLFQASADEQPAPQMFDRNACYSNCPCDVIGMEEACLNCKQKCDDKFWKEFDKEEAAAEN